MSSLCFLTFFLQSLYCPTLYWSLCWNLRVALWLCPCIIHCIVFAKVSVLNLNDKVVSYGVSRAETETKSKYFQGLIQSCIHSTGCRPPTPFLYAREGRLKSFERGNYPPPPHLDRRAIQPNQMQLRTCSVLAPMWTISISENIELTQGAL